LFKRKPSSKGSDDGRQAPLLAPQNGQDDDCDTDQATADGGDGSWDEGEKSETEEELIERMSHQIPQLPPDLFHSALFQPNPDGGSVDHIMTYNHRLKMAADYCDDALHNRNLQVTPTSWGQKAAQRMSTNAYLDGLVILTIMFQMLLAVWEDPTDSSKDPEWVELSNWCCQAVYVLDVFLGMAALGNERFFRKKWNVFRCCAILFMFVGTASDRPLRSALLISRVATLRHTVNSMAMSIPKAVEVFVLFGVTIIFYSVLGQVLFKGDYIFTTDPNGHKNATNSTVGVDDEFTGSFDSFSRAALAMFVLSTTENYPMIMYPAQDTKPITGTIFFMSYIMIMVYIILALFQAALYKTWSEELERQQTKLRVRRYHSLLAAYHVLLDDGSKNMSLEVWIDLVGALRKDVDESEMRLMFMVIDTEQTGSVNLKQFLTGAVEALTYDFDDIRKEMEMSEAISKGNMFCGKGVRVRLKRIMRRRAWRVFIYLVAIAHTVFVVLAPLPLEYPRDTPYRVVLGVLLFFSVVEMSFKLIAYPIVRYWKGFSRFDLLVISASVVTEFIFPLVSGNPADPEGNWARATQCLRVMRLISLSKRMRQLTTTVAGVREVILRFFLVFSLLVYSFAGIAVLIFNGNISEEYDPNDDDQFDVLDPQAQLNTMDEALLALFQIAVTNNWQDIMFIHIVDGQKVKMWGSVFFITYFVVVVWFGTNIMGAVVIEAYVTAVDRRDLEARSAASALTRRRNAGNFDPNSRRRSSGPGLGSRSGAGPAPASKKTADSSSSSSSLPSPVESEFLKRLDRSHSSRLLHGTGPSSDLRDSEVLGMLRREVDRTHDSVRRNSVKISERLMGGKAAGGAGKGKKS